MDYRNSNQSPRGRRRFPESREPDNNDPWFARGPRRGEGHNHHDSHHEDTSRRGGRSRRGDVRIAVLSLLAERPMHGYEMMQELSERTKGIWRPSPGSLYPALQLLEDQGLVTSSTSEGRRQFTLTDKGREELGSQPRKFAPWETMVRGANQDDFALRVALRQVSIAVSQVAEAGTPDQKARAERLVHELRRQIYLLLAENTATTEAPSA